MIILLVEDHADTRQAIRSCLEMKGHSVAEAWDVKSALSAAAAPFDLLLCDIGLPDGDGWTLLETLKKTRAINAIAISGYCSPKDVARSKAAGFLTHLPKPFSLEDFDATLATISTSSAEEKSTGDKKKQVPIVRKAFGKVSTRAKLGRV